MRGSSLVAGLAIILALALSAGLLVYVPLKLSEDVRKGGNAYIAGIIGFLSVIIGAVIAFISVAVGIPSLVLLPKEVPTWARKREDWLTSYRARQRAMLEELDEVKKLLEEIRDILKEGIGE